VRREHIVGHRITITQWLKWTAASASTITQWLKWTAAVRKHHHPMAEMDAAGETPLAAFAGLVE